MFLAKSANPNYRPDVDGLRAVAVLMVLGYHIGTRFLHGGFIGVDIFFVISGYLITKILYKEINEGRFSISAFYVRRIRRIAPALIGVLIVTTVVAYFALLPSELKDYSHSLLAAIFSVSNFYFWSQAGYFDAQALSKPLLHTWSLAVEEQFYIFFPVLLAFVFRFKRRWLIPVFAFLAVASFALSAWAAFHSRDFAFYWPVTRIWELLCGAFVAVGATPAIKSAPGRNAAALLGLGLICFASARYSDATPFPGIAALAPCIGTALIIIAGTNGTTLVNRALSLRPVVFIGLISYSLYLWHWPILVFQSMGEGVGGGVPVVVRKGLMALASLIMATLSWYFVERPFRTPNKRTPNRRVFEVAAACAAVPAIAACVFLLLNGLPSRFPSASITVASYLGNGHSEDRANYRAGSCFITSSYKYSDYQPASCLQEDSSRPDYLIMGDSHAAQLYYGLSTVFKDATFLQATASGCKPTLRQGMYPDTNCVQLIGHVLHDYLPRAKLKAVLIGGNWTESDLGRLGETLAYIKTLHLQPILFGPVVQYDAPLPRLLAISIKKSDASYPAMHRIAASRSLDRKMASLSANVWQVEYVSYYQALCDGSACMEYAAPDVPLQADTTHFTSLGSVVFAGKLRDSHLIEGQDSVAEVRQVPSFPSRIKSERHNALTGSTRQ